MICAYDKVYLDKARISLGRMLDFAVHDLGYDLEEFLYNNDGIVQISLSFEDDDKAIKINEYIKR